MRFTKIPSDTWAIVEAILRRYPEQKEEYINTREELLESKPFNDGMPRSNFNANRTEAAVIKLNSPRMQRIEKEIRAVEKAYNSLKTEEEKKVIRVRYWTKRWRKIPFHRIANVAYSERQMRRIVYKVIKIIAEEMGEI